MKRRICYFTLAAFLLSTILIFPWNALAEDAAASAPEKKQCAEMIRFGKQSYERGKYLDAKEYFRKAVQADPSSSAAWRHYDLAVIYALAEKVNKNTDLIAPDASPQAPAAPTAAAPPPPPEQPAPVKKPKFVIVEDEGC
jgi:TPR repeat protein